MDPDAEREAPESESQTRSTQTPDEQAAADKLWSNFRVAPGEARHGVTAMRSLGTEEFQFRAADPDKAGDGLGLLHGHFAVFDRWTKIDSMFEGRFMERIAPGAFDRTFKNNGDQIRCLFQHGRDPSIGMKVLGTPRTVSEDDHGAKYEVPLDDTSYNRDLLPGLRSGQYGASFRFQVMAEEVVRAPAKSDHNPEGIEERTITEVRVREFGPVTFGAYAEATSGVRAVTDDYLLTMQREVGPQLLLARALEFWAANNQLQTREEPSPEPPAETPPAPEAESRSEEPETTEEPPERAAEGTTEPESPDEPSPTDRVRTTRLPAEVQPLRTSLDMEEKPWRL